jgi:anti-anti-sigma factor
MEIVSTQEADVAVFSVTGRLDALSVPELEEQLGKWLEQAGKALVIDFEGLEYISSAGLRILLATAKKMKARGGKLCLSRLRTNVKEVFDISGFSAIIPIFDNLGAARDAAK